VAKKSMPATTKPMVPGFLKKAEGPKPKDGSKPKDGPKPPKKPKKGGY